MRVTSRKETHTHTVARVVTTVLVDDLEGDESDTIDTVTFGFDGATYEIDLSEGNGEKMAAALAPTSRPVAAPVGVARGATGPPRTAAPRTDKEQLDVIRAWASSNGHEVSDRGRIPKPVREAYDAAH